MFIACGGVNVEVAIIKSIEALNIGRSNGRMDPSIKVDSLLKLIWLID